MKKLLDVFLEKSIMDKNKDLSNDLFYGKAGIAIYYAIKSNQDKSVQKFYNKFVNDILANVNENTPMTLEKGLLGVCLSIDIILKYYKKGNPDYVLENLDSMIYSKFCINQYKEHQSLDNYIDALFYLSYHLKLSLYGKERRQLFIRESMVWIDYVYSYLPSNFFEEPLPFSIIHKPLLFLDSLECLYTQGIHCDRICHILNEIAYSLNLPTRHANRLALLYVVKKICITVEGLSVYWFEFADILTNHISMERIFNKEIKNRQIFFGDGLSGIYLLILGCNRLLGYKKFNIDINYYFRRVMDSDVTKKLKKEIPYEAYSLNGYWGINLFYEYLRNAIL
jgi:hypothetical protein